MQETSKTADLLIGWSIKMGRANDRNRPHELPLLSSLTSGQTAMRNLNIIIRSPDDHKQARSTFVLVYAIGDARK